MDFLWWHRGVIYQIYPRSFMDSNGDGIGDLAGIISRLDYVAHVLGVDAIWLSPIYPSPMADFGYDISNYTNIDPIFGSLQTFDELLDQAHQRGLKVLIDFVPNHTSDQHPWFIESRSSRTSPKRDWYIWADAKPDGSAPNNWLSVFGGSAWEWDEQTGQYYLHSFLKAQPDLNWRNPEVQAAMFDVIRFWLERGVDGFRVDVAHYLMKDPGFRDNPPNPDVSVVAYKSLGNYDSQLHLYDFGHPDIHNLYRQFRALLDSYSQTAPRFSVGEVHVFKWDDWAKFYGEKLDELHMPFNFALVGAAWKADKVRAIVDAIEAALPPGAWPNYVYGNHDEHRMVSRVGAAQARIALMLILTLRGTPTMYYGDEIAMHDVQILPHQVRDPWEFNVPGMGLGRDPERTPMQWDNTPNAGFCAPGCNPWLPIAADYQQINVQTELNDPTSMLSLARWLLALRRQSAALQVGTYTPVDDVPADCFVYVRQAGTERQLIALNFSSQKQVLTLPKTIRADKIHLHISTLMDRDDPIDLTAFTLRPDEGCVIELT